jgi:hypothetical protein
MERMSQNQFWCFQTTFNLITILIIFILVAIITTGLDLRQFYVPVFYLYLKLFYPLDKLGR